MRVQAQTSDVAAATFRDMYEATLPAVYGFLLVRAGKSQAEELTAETYAAAVVLFKEQRGDEVTLSWLRTVARRRLIDSWRRASIAAENVIHLLPPKPDEADAEISATVVAALDALSEPQRKALVLQHIEGYSVVEIAELLGRSPTGTQSLLNRARVAFRAAYEEAENA